MLSEVCVELQLSSRSRQLDVPAGRSDVITSQPDITQRASTGRRPGEQQRYAQCDWSLVQSVSPGEMILFLCDIFAPRSTKNQQKHRVVSSRRAERAPCSSTHENHRRRRVLMQEMEMCDW